MIRWLLSSIVFFSVVVTNASADTRTWKFSTGTRLSLGSASHTFVSDGIGIPASSSADLSSKSGGGDENGLHLICCDCDHEINPGQSMMFDLSSLFSHKVTSLELMLGSIENGESAKVDVLLDQMEATSSSVPEPSSLLLVGNGIFVLAGAGGLGKGLRRK